MSTLPEEQRQPSTSCRFLLPGGKSRRRPTFITEAAERQETKNPRKMATFTDSRQEPNNYLSRKNNARNCFAHPTHQAQQATLRPMAIDKERHNAVLSALACSHAGTVACRSSTSVHLPAGYWPVPKTGVAIFAAHSTMDAHALKPSTGHGEGFAAVHATAIPQIHPESPDILREAMPYSIEPAAYSDGYDSIQHFHLVAETSIGATVLTHFRE